MNQRREPKKLVPNHELGREHQRGIPHQHKSFIHNHNPQIANGK